MDETAEAANKTVGVWKIEKEVILWKDALCSRNDNHLEEATSDPCTALTGKSVYSAIMPNLSAKRNPVPDKILFLVLNCCCSNSTVSIFLFPNPHRGALFLPQRMAY